MDLIKLRIHSETVTISVPKCNTFAELRERSKRINKYKRFLTKLFKMKTKICTKCKKELPNNENYFHLDSSKVRLGHLVVLASACKVCKNERKRIQSVTYRNKIAAEFGTNYQKRKLDDPMFLEKCKVREKKYNEKKNERNRKRWNTIPEVREKHLALNKKRTLKEVAELPDYYIARLVTRNSKILKPNDILNQKEFIETYRENLKLKRLCRQ